jgi:hypothetical protein
MLLIFLWSRRFTEPGTRVVPFPLSTWGVNASACVAFQLNLTAPPVVTCTAAPAAAGAAPAAAGPAAGAAPAKKEEKKEESEEEDMGFSLFD